MLREELTLTADEEKALRALSRLAKRWPKTLLLGALHNEIYVYKGNPDGTARTRVYLGLTEFDEDSCVYSASFPTVQRVD